MGDSDAMYSFFEDEEAEQKHATNIAKIFNNPGDGEFYKKSESVSVTNQLAIPIFHANDI
ncbi:MAG: hypothetical protein GY820_24005 [Gammaproteobacteria bacterium]|nr:hypothetical protein [Gammaproteobacteria bacterium]